MKQPEQSVETDKVLRFAHRFEEIVIIILYGVIALITIFALIRLALAIFDAAFTSWDVKNVYSLQVLFAMVLTVLIALELGNTILRHLREHSTIVQAQEIILIGMMAVVRKIMLIDLSTVSAGLLAALASVALALSAAYWFTRKMDER
ncbi:MULTISPECIES: phosphate-starvation-inducible PsiE family protein [Rhodobacterales]|uniref:phosphate-starvation-inducible PsiE family protein n=1 Tax=Rhodobacterales TaxID=204455 RepID=UPI0015F03951|nr:MULTISPECIES: phosphate-starvation-inducible PsiE family protein [Rhodobacterales]MDO6591743.1 phosphate-starvation-inducible PsiE family protein [Yoonia sp. 1_MG-2023]